jgi:TorA maturation chaperone TorD
LNSPSPAERAQERSQIYGLISRLYLEGLTGDLLDHILAISELAAALPDPFDADETAADHHHLFGFNVFPYEGIFLDPAGLLGGEIAGMVLRSYQQVVFAPSEGRLAPTESADHIGHELSYLAFLSAAESKAREEELPSQIQNMIDHQRRFLDLHLLRWLPPLVLAIKQQRDSLFSALADLTIDLSASHWTDIWDERQPHAGVPFASPQHDLPSTLGSDEVLRGLANYLLIPVYSGFYLSRDDIGRLARKHELPRGFGRRRGMLMNLLRSAMTYESLGALLDSFALLAGKWGDAYRHMDKGQVYARFWRVRVEETASALEKISRNL